MVSRKKLFCIFARILRSFWTLWEKGPYVQNVQKFCPVKHTSPSVNHITIFNISLIKEVLYINKPVSTLAIMLQQWRWRSSLVLPDIWRAKEPPTFQNAWAFPLCPLLYNQFGQSATQSKGWALQCKLLLPCLTPCLRDPGTLLLCQTTVICDWASIDRAASLSSWDYGCDAFCCCPAASYQSQSLIHTVPPLCPLYLRKVK